MLKNNANVEQYISKYPKNVRTLLTKVRNTIKKSAPEAEEIISYGMPSYRYKGILLYFGAQKNHIGLYPLTSAIKKFKKPLSKYQTSKGTIRFNLD